MKSQISEDSFRPEKRYSGVYQQQGRPLRDADQNESTDVLKHRQDQASEKAIRSGAPREGGAGIEGLDGRGLPLIRAGALFADGLPAQIIGPGPASPEDAAPPQPEVFPFDQQFDYPASIESAYQPPASPPSGYVLFADVWERVVIFLEDLELMDPALHGVDTCTRTQTMAQVKWCAREHFETAPDDEPLVLAPPAKGNAPLTVEARSAASEADPCDPCATVVQAETELGNYLFRIEVHRVTRDGPAGRPTEIVLKWSSENGAEHHPAADAPDTFKAYDGIFEFFSTETERHLGVCWSQAIEPSSGQLDSEFPSTPPAALPFVRRWDGCCVLARDNSGTWSMGTGSPDVIPNVDRDQFLSVAAGTNHGDVGFDGGAVRIQLQHLTLVLDLEDRDFVRGDYWLARVRSAQNAAGAKILDAAEPVGVTHHYVWLVEVNTTGQVVELSDAQRRRLAFPPLTDVKADEVGFIDRCDKLYNGAENVQEALDELCNIHAEDIAYTAQCRNLSSVENVKEALDLLGRLAALHYVGGDGQTVTADNPVAPQLCEVRVLSHCGPVEKAKVRFVAHGNGRVAPSLVGLSSASSNEISLETGPDGIASCAWRLDPTGEKSQQLTATLISTDPPSILSKENDHIRFNAQFVETGRASDPGTHIECILFPNENPFLIEVLENDQSFEVELLKAGIVILCDREIVSPRFPPKLLHRLKLPEVPVPPIVQLVLEVPEDAAMWVFHPVIANAGVQLIGRTIRWGAAHSDFFDKYLQQVFSNLPDEPQRVLARLVVRGNFIWSEENGDRLYLDAESFGAKRRDGRIEALLPSGDGIKGGTFETWFWLERRSSDQSSKYALSLGAGLHAIANHLINGSNKLSEVLPGVPDGSTLYKWTGSSFEMSQYIQGVGWEPDLTLGPGEGAMLEIREPVVLVFEGTRKPFPLDPVIQPGVHLVGRQLPGAGIYENIVGRAPAEGSQVYRLKTGATREMVAPGGVGYDIFTFKQDRWTPYTPTVDLGESVFVRVL